jgi:hypothetical protein
MTKFKAIRKFCLECVGGNAKDAAFCTDPKCPLWEHRLGADLRSTKGIEMMKKNCQKYPQSFKELEKYGVDPALFLPRTPRRIGPKPLNKGLQAFNSRQKELDLGGGETLQPS